MCWVKPCRDLNRDLREAWRARAVMLWRKYYGEETMLWSLNNALKPEWWRSWMVKAVRTIRDYESFWYIVICFFGECTNPRLFFVDCALLYHYWRLPIYQSDLLLINEVGLVAALKRVWWLFWRLRSTWRLPWFYFIDWYKNWRQTDIYAKYIYCLETFICCWCFELCKPRLLKTY